MILLLFCASTGCTSLGEYVGNGFKVGPNYKRPPAPVAEEWIDANDKRVRSEETDDICHWWTLFQDPVLDELIADAYRQNLTLREAGFRILQARANLGYAIGTFFPQQQYMSGDYLRAAISTEAANRPFVLDRYYSQNDLGFTLAWELDFWGRYRRAIEAADAELSATVEDYDDVMVTMLGDIANAYVNMRIFEAQIAYTQANVRLQQQTLDIAKARFKGGLVTELDVDQAQSILSQTEAEVPQLQISLRLMTNQLCVLLGIPSEDLRKRMAVMPIPTAPADIAVGIPADLLRRRPDVRRAERRAAAQAARIGIAESDFYPHISINGTLGGQAAQFNDLLNTKALQGGVGPGFQWNLLNYGRILNNVRAQDALFQELVVAYQQKVLTADQEAENGLVTFLKSQEQARYMAESVTAAQKAVVVAIAQYKGGLVDFNRVSLVEQNLVTQQNSYAQAFGAIANGLVQTYRALGGGWQLRLDPEADMAPGLPHLDEQGESIPPPDVEQLPNLNAPAQDAAPPVKPAPVKPASVKPAPVEQPPAKPASAKHAQTKPATAKPMSGELVAPKQPLPPANQLSITKQAAPGQPPATTKAPKLPRIEAKPDHTPTGAPTETPQTDGPDLKSGLRRANDPRKVPVRPSTVELKSVSTSALSTAPSEFRPTPTDAGRSESRSSDLRIADRERTTSEPRRLPSSEISQPTVDPRHDKLAKVSLSIISESAPMKLAEVAETPQPKSSYALSDPCVAEPANGLRSNKVTPTIFRIITSPTP